MYVRLGAIGFTASPLAPALPCSSICSRFGTEGLRAFDRFMEQAEIEIMAVDVEQARTHTPLEKDRAFGV